MHLGPVVTEGHAVRAEHTKPPMRGAPLEAEPHLRSRPLPNRCAPGKYPPTTFFRVDLGNFSFPRADLGNLPRTCQGRKTLVFPGQAAKICPPSKVTKCGVSIYREKESALLGHFSLLLTFSSHGIHLLLGNLGNPPLSPVFSRASSSQGHLGRPWFTLADSVPAGLDEPKHRPRDPVARGWAGSL